jgi:hypothetical protein
MVIGAATEVLRDPGHRHIPGRAAYKDGDGQASPTSQAGLVALLGVDHRHAK